MAPGVNGAKLHSLSKCCCHPVLPGKGKGDPRLILAAVTLRSRGAQRATPPLPLPCWRVFPLCVQTWLSPSPCLGVPAWSTRARERACHMPTEERAAEGGEEPRRAASRPQGRRWHRFQPDHHKFGTLHKSNLRLSAGVSPPPAPALHSSSAVTELTAHPSDPTAQSAHSATHTVLAGSLCSRSQQLQGPSASLWTPVEP